MNVMAAYIPSAVTCFFHVGLRLKTPVKIKSLNKYENVKPLLALRFVACFSFNRSNVTTSAASRNSTNDFPSPV